MPQEDHRRGEVNHPEEVVGVPFPARDDATEVVKPSKEPLDFPAPTPAAQRPALLRPRATIRQVWSDQFDVVLGGKMLIQSVAVVRRVADQSCGSSWRKRAARVASTSCVSCVPRFIIEIDATAPSSRDSDQSSRSRRTIVTVRGYSLDSLFLDLTP